MGGEGEGEEGGSHNIHEMEDSWLETIVVDDGKRFDDSDDALDD